LLLVVVLGRMFSRSIPTLARLSAPIGVLGLASLAVPKADCSEDCLPCLDYGWSHRGFGKSFDSASVRRGFQVYRQVCASCHSINYVAFRSLVGVTHDEASMKKLAESYEITDGPNDAGDMFERPGKLSDTIPGPYKNDEQARAANNGALPPDLSLAVKSRHYNVDYIFALLTGYCEAPAGKVMLPGLHYNPYFPGGATAMAKQLTDGQVEFEDGTPATESQMAKDVATFLTWASYPEHNERQKMAIQYLVALAVGILLTGYYKRFRWSSLKSRKITYANNK